MLKDKILFEVKEMYPRTILRIARKYRTDILDVNEELAQYELSEMLYRFVYDIKETGCKLCNNRVKFLGFKRGYMSFCSQKCASIYNNSVPDIKSKMRKGKIAAFNKKTEEEKKITEQKKRETSFKHYGVHNHMLTAESRQHYSDIMRANAKERMTKMKNTLIEKYGADVTNVSLIPSVRKNKNYVSLYRNHEFITEKGKSFILQGYGIKAVQKLLESYDEDDIFVEKQIAPIPYIDKNGKNRLYFPDILLYSTNTIIEVKDQYWFDRTFENNILKAKATLSKGFNFEFWILKKENTWEIKKL